MEILIGLTILAVIVRVVIFFCVPELDRALSRTSSPNKTYKYQPDNIEENHINPNESSYIIGPWAKHDPNYSPYIGKHND